MKVFLPRSITRSQQIVLKSNRSPLLIFYHKQSKICIINISSSLNLNQVIAVMDVMECEKCFLVKLTLNKINNKTFMLR